MTIFFLSFIFSLFFLIFSYFLCSNFLLIFLIFFWKFKIQKKIQKPTKSQSQKVQSQQVNYLTRSGARISDPDHRAACDPVVLNETAPFGPVKKVKLNFFSFFSFFSLSNQNFLPPLSKRNSNSGGWPSLLSLSLPSFVVIRRHL